MFSGKRYRFFAEIGRALVARRARTVLAPSPYQARAGRAPSPRWSRAVPAPGACWSRAVLAPSAPGARWSRSTSGEKPRLLAALSHKKTRYPHEVDTGQKARTGRGVLLVVTCGCLSCRDSLISIGSVWPRPVGECWVIIALLDSKLEGLGAELLPLVDLI